MEGNSDLLNYLEEAFIGSMDQLVTADGLSFAQVGEHFHYSESTMRNIIRQRSHNPDWRRIVAGLKSLSRSKNLRLHKHVLDGSQWECVPRYGGLEARGNIAEEFIAAVRALVKAEDAVASGNLEKLAEAKQALQKVVAQIGVEQQCMSMQLQKAE
nr:hypothetical protein 16 [Balneolaceae bacterium]